MNLEDFGTFGDRLPQTVDELTDRIVHIGPKVLLNQRSEHLYSFEPTDLSDVQIESLKANDEGNSIWAE